VFLPVGLARTRALHYIQIPATLRVINGVEMQDIIRTFIAAEVPVEQKQKIDEAVAHLRDEFHLGWTKPAGWHLTMKFLGEIAPKKVKTATTVVQDIMGHVRPFSIRLGGWDASPNADKPRVLWLGVCEGGDEFVGAAKQIDTALGDHGFERDHRTTHPHLTLARARDGKGGAEAFQALSTIQLELEPFTIDRVIVFSSKLGRGGAQYEPLAECLLG
jgi:RNA 2',3'-cyclic 3'-phosphodiesterase